MQIDKSCVYKKLLSKGLSVPAPGIHVYDHNIQTSSLKQIGQSKPNFMRSIVRKGDEKLYKWSGLHDDDGRHGYK